MIGPSGKGNGEFAGVYGHKLGVSACVVNGKYLFAFGGYDGCYVLSDIEKYDIETN